jgi:hypothetical protein
MPSRSSSSGSYVVILHPLGLPQVQVRVIEYRIEPHIAARLAEFPSSHTTNHPDPGQVHRLVTTLLDPRASHPPSSLSCVIRSALRWKPALMSTKITCA